MAARSSTGSKIKSNITIVLVVVGIVFGAVTMYRNRAPELAKAPRNCGDNQVMLVVPKDSAEADTLANLVSDNETITGNTHKIAELNNMQPRDKLWDPDGITCLTVKGKPAAASSGNG